MQAITPNPARLPGLFLVGEAFSPHQGWTEGALWTADKASSIILAQRSGGTSAASALMGKHAQGIKLEIDESAAKRNTFKGGKEKKIMAYKGIVIDVSDWSQRHPGGVGPILGHTGEDFGDLFDNFQACTIWRNLRLSRRNIGTIVRTQEYGSGTGTDAGREFASFIYAGVF